MNEHIEVWLWILLVMQPYNPKSKRILDRCDGDVVRAAQYIRDGCPILSEAEQKRAQRVRSGDVRKVLEVCAKNDIRIVTLEDEEYPLRLKVIYNPPILLFVKGSIEWLDDEVSISVVGTRRPDNYSVQVGNRLCSDLTKIGTVIVSGLAVGLDTVAHRACINSGGRTIGVLACGMLVDYPKESAALKEDILKTGGALVSELLPFTGTFGSYFKHRNRIIAGLGMGTLILEASSKSGCLLTAEHTIEQGRDLFCVPPHDILSSRYAGVMPLLRDGAVPVFSYIDIVNANLYSYLRKSSYIDIMSYKAAEPKPEKAKGTKPKPGQPPAPEKEEERTAAPDESVLSELSPQQAEIVRIIAQGAIDIDTLIMKTGMSFVDANSDLIELEISGLVERGMDGFYKYSGK
ncbi:MAG: DNA-processing protein DprA [Oscillospiraceae bacterium]